MKVTPIGAGRSTDPARRTKSTGKAGEFAEHLKEAAASGEVQAPRESAPVGGIDSVLAAQEVPDALDARTRKQAVDRGGQILDKLDNLRLRLLEGSLSKGELAEIARLVRARRRSIDDPRLREIVDEIELRAEVEIAKLTRDS